MRKHTSQVFQDNQGPFAVATGWSSFDRHPQLGIPFFKAHCSSVRFCKPEDQTSYENGDPDLAAFAAFAEAAFLTGKFIDWCKPTKLQARQFLIERFNDIGLSGWTEANIDDALSGHTFAAANDNFFFGGRVA